MITYLKALWAKVNPFSPHAFEVREVEGIPYSKRFWAREVKR